MNDTHTQTPQDQRDHRDQRDQKNAHDPDASNNDTFTEQDDAAASEASQHDEQAPTARQLPIRRLGYGRLQAAIWRNELRDGSINYSVTFRRSYTNAGGQWCDSLSFGRDDMLPLAKLANDAHTAIFELQRETRQRQDQSSQQPRSAGNARAERGRQRSEPTASGQSRDAGDGDDDAAAATNANHAVQRRVRETGRSR